MNATCCRIPPATVSVHHGVVFSETEFPNSIFMKGTYEKNAQGRTAFYRNDFPPGDGACQLDRP
jgi:hypothetical protein